MNSSVLSQAYFSYCLPLLYGFKKHLAPILNPSDIKDLSSTINNRELLNSKGQTLVEFVFMLAIIMTMSMLFMKLLNGNIATFWRFFVTQIVRDPSINLTL